MNDKKRQEIECVVKKLKTKYNNNYVYVLHSLISSTVRYIALKYLHNVADAEDLIQDFWFDIKRIVDSYRFYKNAYGYLCKVVQNMAINRVKKIQRTSELVIEYVQFSEFYKEADEEKFNIQYTVEKAMNCLSKVQKIIIQTTYFEGRTIREIAKDLNMSKSSAEREKLSALRLLKEELNKYYYD